MAEESRSSHDSRLHLAEHEAELAAAGERHRHELATLEADLRVRLAERVRVRLIELAARGARDRAGASSTPGAA